MKKETCEHCGASMMANAFTMSRTLVRSLAKMMRNPRAMARDCGFTKTEYSVYTKLKFWGFIERLEDGLWIVTPAGKEFMAGQLRTHKKIFFFRDKLIRTEGTTNVWEVLPSEESKQKYREMMQPVLGKVGEEWKI